MIAGVPGGTTNTLAFDVALDAAQPKLLSLLWFRPKGMPLLGSNSVAVGARACDAIVLPPYHTGFRGQGGWGFWEWEWEYCLIEE